MSYKFKLPNISLSSLTLKFIKGSESFVPNSLIWLWAAEMITAWASLFSEKKNRGTKLNKEDNFIIIIIIIIMIIIIIIIYLFTYLFIWEGWGSGVVVVMWTCYAHL